MGHKKIRLLFVSFFTQPQLTYIPLLRYTIYVVKGIKMRPETGDAHLPAAFIKAKLFLAVHVLDKHKHFVGVAPLVIVPANKFNKLVCKCDTGLLVEDRGKLATDKVA